MKKLFILFVLLFSSVSMAQVVGNQNCSKCVNVAGRTIDLSNSNVKVLSAAHNTTGYDTFRHDADTALGRGAYPEYIVPSSTKAVFLGVKAYGHSASTQVMRIMYTDDARDNLNSAPTNPVYHTGTVNSADGDYMYLEATASGNANKVAEIGFNFSAPSGKYITHFTDSSGGATITLYIGECPDTGSCEFK